MNTANLSELETALQPKPVTETLRVKTNQELRALKASGVRHPGLADECVTDTVADLFEAAEADHAAEPEEIRSWTTSRTQIEYRHPLFGKLLIGVKNCSLGEPQHEGPDSWARVYSPTPRPNWLEIEMSVTTIHRDIKVIEFAADPDSHSDDQFANEVICKIAPFPVKVQWQKNRENGDWVPFTRVKHRDNLDLIILNPESGQFIQLEISITTRNGFCWLLVEEQYSGQWVRTTKTRAETLGVKNIAHGQYPLLVMPLYAANAYPTADYVRTFPELAEQMSQFVIRWGALVPFGKCVKATWAPETRELTEEMVAKSWKKATPLFFNGVIGHGPALCEDGKICFLHFSKIMGADGSPVGCRGQFPIIPPMREVAVKWMDQPDGKRAATAIRVI
ncbi:MAG: hypothetical protein V4467_00525 [Patescibacteria group bacterium]